MSKHVRGFLQTARDITRYHLKPYRPEDFPRDFAKDLDALNMDTMGGRLPDLGMVNQWLEGRDGFPLFEVDYPLSVDMEGRKATAAYRADRDRHARALLAALQLWDTAGPKHAPWCAINAPPEESHGCDCEETYP